MNTTSTPAEYDIMSDDLMIIEDQTTINNMLSENTELKQRNIELDTKLSDLQTYNTDLCEKSKTLEINNSKLEEENKTLKNTLETLQDDINNDNIINNIPCTNTHVNAICHDKPDRKHTPYVK